MFTRCIVFLALLGGALVTAQSGDVVPTNASVPTFKAGTTDAALKRSRMTPEMALDLLVVNFGTT